MTKTNTATKTNKKNTIAKNDEGTFDLLFHTPVKSTASMVIALGNFRVKVLTKGKNIIGLRAGGEMLERACAGLGVEAPALAQLREAVAVG